jgi:ADP-ribosyl-[dinitrogen reductase] hydrolase
MMRPWLQGIKWGGFVADTEPTRDRVRGCLLGLAVGDAYGAPLEFLHRREILSKFGPDGPDDLAPWGGLPGGSYTDDTQMSVATARGLLDWRAASGWAPGAAVDHDALAQAVWQRYLDWYRSREWEGRAPGTACLKALRNGKPVADNKGCGGVMRVAPLGCAGLEGAAFEAGARAAALTHAHHTSDAASGFQALLVERLVGGDELRVAVAAARGVLAAWPGSGGALDAVDTAIALAGTASAASADTAIAPTGAAVAPAGPASVATYEALGRIGHVGVETPDGDGKGWVAEEAMGIGLFCALRFAGDFAAALRAAALISGDSDSTASIAGAILGAAGGLAAIPSRWADKVEGRDELLGLADALAGPSDERNGPPGAASRPAGPV